MHKKYITSLQNFFNSTLNAQRCGAIVDFSKFGFNLKITSIETLEIIYS